MVREIERMNSEATIERNNLTTLTATVRLRRPLKPKIAPRARYTCKVDKRGPGKKSGAFHTPSKPKTWRERKAMGIGKGGLDLKSFGDTEKFNKRRPLMDLFITVSTNLR